MLVSAFRSDFVYPRAAAAAVADLVPAFFVDVGPGCNFSCPFCSVPRRNGFRPVGELESLVEAAGRHRLGRGFFTGGEPSIYPELERLMIHARSRGVKRFGVSTNGSGFADAARVQALERLGLTAWQLSWDDHRPEVADRLRGRAGVADLLLRVLEALSGLGRSSVSLNQVVVEDNYAALPDMVAFVAGLRERFPCIRWLLVSLVKPVGEALNHLELVPSPQVVVPSLYRSIEVAQRARLPLVLNNVPACLIPERPEYGCSSFEHLQLYDTRSGRTFPMRFPGYALRKADACLRCTRFERCNGFWQVHSDLHGDAAYHPTGALVRERPLHPAFLTRELEEREALRQLLERSAAPQALNQGWPPAAPGSGSADPALPNLRNDDRSNRIRQLEHVLKGGWLGGWAHRTCSLHNDEHGWIATVELCRASPLRRLVVKIAPSTPRRSAYRRTAQLAIWHAGTDLDPERERVLQQLCARVEAADALVARVLELR